MVPQDTVFRATVEVPSQMSITGGHGGTVSLCIESHFPLDQVFCCKGLMLEDPGRPGHELYMQAIYADHLVKPMLSPDFWRMGFQGICRSEALASLIIAGELRVTGRNAL